MQTDVPVLTWVRDPNGTVWAIDAADVMTKAPDAVPVKDVDWSELDRYIPAGTMMATSAYMNWHLGPVLVEGGKLLRAVFPWFFWLSARIKRR